MEDWSLRPFDLKCLFPTISMIGLVFGLQKNVCIHTCIFWHLGFFFGGFAHGLRGGGGAGLWGLANAPWTGAVVKLLCLSKTKKNSGNWASDFLVPSKKVKGLKVAGSGKEDGYLALDSP